MKKIKKINLELNKEVISFLSNEDMNQVKGGVTQGGNTCGTECQFPIETYQTACLKTLEVSCICIATTDCPSKGVNLCYISQDTNCVIAQTLDAACELVLTTKVRC